MELQRVIDAASFNTAIREAQRYNDIKRILKICERATIEGLIDGAVDTGFPDALHAYVMTIGAVKDEPEIGALYANIYRVAGMAGAVGTHAALYGYIKGLSVWRPQNKGVHFREGKGWFGWLLSNAPPGVWFYRDPDTFRGLNAWSTELNEHGIPLRFWGAPHVAWRGPGNSSDRTRLYVSGYAESGQVCPPLPFVPLS